MDRYIYITSHLYLDIIDHMLSCCICTRLYSRPQVNEILLDPTGPLAALHQRVLDAGCEVDPDGNPVKALFVPCTQQQLLELQGLAVHGCSAYDVLWTIYRCFMMFDGWRVGSDVILRPSICFMRMLAAVVLVPIRYFQYFSKTIVF